jgi:3-methylcrotonyl-CoA carboxylase alpha subunit
MKVTVRLSSQNATYTAAVDGGRVTIDGAPELIVRDEGDGRFSLDTRAGLASAISAPAGDIIWIGLDGHAIDFRIERGAGARPVSHDDDALRAPMPATVVRLNVEPGRHVDVGDTLVVLEAMKMELPVRAPRAGTVRAVHCSVGELVAPETVLVELE